MSKRFWVLISSGLLLGSLLGGATFALFADSTSAQSNTFTAGTLTVALTDADGEELDGPFMTYDLMAPGDVGGPYQAFVKNTGTLPLVYNFKFALVGGLDDADEALADALLLQVERENADGSWADLGEMSAAAWDTADPSGWQPQLSSGAMARWRVTATLPPDTGNDAQAGSITVSLLIAATQTSVVESGAPVLTGTWRGFYTGAEAPPGEPLPQWRFVATVVQTGSSFSGTMVELDDPSVGVTSFSGTISGMSVEGTRQYPVSFGSEPLMWSVDFTGDVQPDGRLAIGTAESNSRNWSAAKD